MIRWHRTRVGVNSGIEWELSSIPDSIPGIGLGIGIEKKGIGIELELTKKELTFFIHVYFLGAIKRMSDHHFCHCSRISPGLCLL